MHATASQLDDHVAMSQACGELLSLALMDTRNRSLNLYQRVQDALQSRDPVPTAQWQALCQACDCPAPTLWLGRLGWFHEAWISRNVQRRRGRAADPSAPRLASIDPLADARWDPAMASAQGLPAEATPADSVVRQYLVDGLEVTLDLLHHHPQDDDSLYFFRLALFHEDEQSERLLDLAQALQLPLPELTSPPLLPQPRQALLPPDATAWACQRVSPVSVKRLTSGVAGTAFRAATSTSSRSAGSNSSSSSRMGDMTTHSGGAPPGGPGARQRRRGCRRASNPLQVR